MAKSKPRKTLAQKVGGVIDIAICAIAFSGAILLCGTVAMAVCKVLCIVWANMFH